VFSGHSIFLIYGVSEFDFWLNQATTVNLVPLVKSKCCLSLLVIGHRADFAIIFRLADNTPRTEVPEGSASNEAVKPF
jgi:hypothetical protein